MENTIDRTRLLHSFYQVSTPAKFTWWGAECKGNKSQITAHKKTRAKRLIKLSPNDILIKSNNGRYFNKINKNGAINIEIPENRVNLVEKTVLFDDTTYKFGFQEIAKKL